MAIGVLPLSRWPACSQRQRVHTSAADTPRCRLRRADYVRKPRALSRCRRETVQPESYLSRSLQSEFEAVAAAVFAVAAARAVLFGDGIQLCCGVGDVAQLCEDVVALA